MTIGGQPGGPAGGATAPGRLHAAYIYRPGLDSLAPVVSFAREGLDRGEAVSIGVTAPLAGLLREALDERGPHALFFDMAELGRNPGRIIPAMLDFAAGRAGRTRYLSQPCWPGRSAAAAAEAMRHEALVNLAFAQADAAILCLYDMTGLGPHVALAAEQTHPTVIRDGQARASSRYAGRGQMPPAFDRPLDPPPARARFLSYSGDLRPVRLHVAECAREAGLADERATDLVLAASEVAANTLRHASGRGMLSVWHAAGEVVCQVQDSGNVADPLAGRWRPADRPSGHGLWVVNQLCDLVELRTGRDGTVVRMHMSL